MTFDTDIIAGKQIFSKTVNVQTFESDDEIDMVLSAAREALRLYRRSSKIDLIIVAKNRCLLKYARVYLTRGGELYLDSIGCVQQLQ